MGHMFHKVLLIMVSCNPVKVMSDTFDLDSSPEIWVPALTAESSPVDFGFEQDEFLNRSQNLFQIDQQLTLSPYGLSVQPLSEIESFSGEEYISFSLFQMLIETVLL